MKTDKLLPKTINLTDSSHLEIVRDVQYNRRVVKVYTQVFILSWFVILLICTVVILLHEDDNDGYEISVMDTLLLIYSCGLFICLQWFNYIENPLQQVVCDANTI